MHRNSLKPAYFLMKHASIKTAPQCQETKNDRFGRHVLPMPWFFVAFLWHKSELRLVLVWIHTFTSSRQLLFPFTASAAQSLPLDSIFSILKNIGWKFCLEVRKQNVASTLRYRIKRVNKKNNVGIWNLPPILCQKNFPVLFTAR